MNDWNDPTIGRATGDDGAPQERRFGHFRVLRTLGRGGQGEVFEAIDERLGEGASRQLPVLTDECEVAHSIEPKFAMRTLDRNAGHLRLDSRVRRHLDPEDLVQEIWWRAYYAYGSYDANRASFRTWIFKIATNVLFDAFRRLRAQPIDAPGLANSDAKRPENLIAQATSISRQVARDEELARMLKSIAALPPEDSRLFLHCALEGLSVAEAAPLAGLGAEAATKRWQRLRTRLRETPTWRRLHAEWHDQ